MASERYFIGPGLKDKLREVIYRVDQIPRVERGANVSTVEQELYKQGRIRTCTFTGSWSIDSTKTVTFVTDTQSTVLATNKLFTIGDACQTQVAYISVVEGDWHLLNVQHTATAVIVNVSLGETAMTFERKLAWIPYPGETTPINIAFTTATSCSY